MTYQVEQNRKTGGLQNHAASAHQRPFMNTMNKNPNQKNGFNIDLNIEQEDLLHKSSTRYKEGPEARSMRKSQSNDDKQSYSQTQPVEHQTQGVAEKSFGELSIERPRIVDTATTIGQIQ